MKINLKELAIFLVKAKSQAYAGEGKEILSQRPDFKELEFSEGDYDYRDSYAGFFFAPGQEVVRFKGKPIWAMAYSGGMLQEYHGDVTFAKQTFTFLKKCLLRIQVARPLRGPEKFQEGDFEYKDTSKGDLSDFSGTEHIFYRGKEVFRQQYIGGLIISK